MNHLEIYFYKDSVRPIFVRIFFSFIALSSRNNVLTALITEIDQQTYYLISACVPIRDAQNFRDSDFSYLHQYTMQDPSRGFTLGMDPLEDYNPFGNPYGQNQTAAAASAPVVSGVPVIF